jgi:hypothetical protein
MVSSVILISIFRVADLSGGASSQKSLSDNSRRKHVHIEDSRSCPIILEADQCSEHFCPLDRNLVCIYVPRFLLQPDSHPMLLKHPLVPMDIQQHVFDTPGNSGLKMVANRYKILPYTEETGLTLLLTHCIGGRESFLKLGYISQLDFENSSSDKEQWEPVIESIVHTQCTKNRDRRIREVWAFDWQSHGDSAVVNHHILNGCQNGVCKLHFTPGESHNNSAEKN